MVEGLTGRTEGGTDGESTHADVGSSSLHHQSRVSPWVGPRVTRWLQPPPDVVVDCGLPPSRPRVPRRLSRLN